MCRVSPRMCIWYGLACSTKLSGREFTIRGWKGTIFLHSRSLLIFPLANTDLSGKNKHFGLVLLCVWEYERKVLILFSLLSKCTVCFIIAVIFLKFLHFFMCTNFINFWEFYVNEILKMKVFQVEIWNGKWKKQSLVEKHVAFNYFFAVVFTCVLFGKTRYLELTWTTLLHFSYQNWYSDSALLHPRNDVGFVYRLESLRFEDDNFTRRRFWFQFICNFEHKLT